MAGSGRKERDYEAITKELKAIEKELENLLKDSRYLSRSADAAESTLQDRVGKKSIDAIRDIANTIHKTASSGEERVRELIRHVENDKERYEELESR